MNANRVLTCLLSFILIFSLMCSLSVTRAVGGELTPMEELGKALFFDKISSPDSMSCASCHAPGTGFTGSIPGINLSGSVYRGAVPRRFGNRKPPSAAYTTFSPIFHYEYDEEEGLFIGGNFWDGRATGEALGNPAADQALGPFLNPVEQNNPSKQAVLEQVAASQYASLWESVWGEPVNLETDEEINVNYNRVGLAIAEYEASSEVNQFSSKYDLYLKGEAELTEQEELGLELFNDENKGNCAACHPSEPGPDGKPPLFTDFTFDNLGTPKNPDNPFYRMDKVYLDDGTPINPDGADWIDKGLGGFLETLSETRPEWYALAEENMGKHKVTTLRNVDKRQGLNFPKAYLHNGVFKSLKEVVHFYNTRDVEDWPEPEVPENINRDELGDLGLTDAEEDAIVAFLKTLSDGYKPRGHNSKSPLLVNILSSTPYQLNSEISTQQFLSNMSITNMPGNNNGNGNSQAFMGPPWTQAEVNGPLWYLNGLTWFKNDSGGPWWWKASLLISPVGPAWYQNDSNAPPWFQDPVKGPWWASALP